jgi:hypothetical protein
MRKTRASTDEKIVLKEIIDLARRIENTSEFVKEMAEKDKKQYNNIVVMLRNDTNGELTDTEYEKISKMMFFCDKFEKMFGEIGVENADTEVLDLYRKMSTQIAVFMKDYREGKKTTPPSIQIIKNYLIKSEKSVDELEDMVFSDGGPEVIDIDAIEKVELEEEKTDGETVRTGKDRRDKEDG